MIGAILAIILIPCKRHAAGKQHGRKANYDAEFGKEMGAHWGTFLGAAIPADQLQANWVHLRTGRNRRPPWQMRDDLPSRRLNFTLDRYRCI